MKTQSPPSKAECAQPEHGRCTKCRREDVPIRWRSTVSPTLTVCDDCWSTWLAMIKQLVGAK